MALAGSQFSYQWGSVQVNATGTTNILITNVTSGTTSQKEIVVFAFDLVRGDTNSGLINITFTDSVPNTLWGPLCILTQGNGNAMAVAEPDIGLFATAPGADLVLTMSQTGIMGGGISYFYR